MYLLNCCVVIELTKRKTKRDKAITWEFCCGLPSSLMFSGLLQKGLFKGRCSLVKCFFKQNYCHACHTRFAVFFPLPSCCVSSLILLDNVVALHKKPHFPAKLISIPEKSFAIGYRSGLLAYMEPSNHLLGNNDFLF